MNRWLLPTLSEILAFSIRDWIQAERGALTAHPSGADAPAHSASTSGSTNSGSNPGAYAEQQRQAEREWTAAIAALNLLLHQEVVTQSQAPASTDIPLGLVLTAPASVLSAADLSQHFSTWVFTPKAMNPLEWLPLQLLPAKEEGIAPAQLNTLSLLPIDPLANEQFCLVLTTQFSLSLVLGKNPEGQPTFLFSFEPEVAEQVWQALRPRLLMTNPYQMQGLETLYQIFAPVVPHYRTVSQFSRFLLQSSLSQSGNESESSTAKLTETIWVRTESEVPASFVPSPSQENTCLQESQAEQDIELLQAIAHEIRTPLTTIRTLTRSLLKRTDLKPEVVKRLEMIDRECSEQIDRFGLIFKAVELETAAVNQSTMPLTATPLDRVFQDSIPRWQKQAHQRSLDLNVVLPQQMPTVVSDPIMLDQALTGLIERFTRSLPAGSQIQVAVTLAGNQLKLQLQSQRYSEGDRMEQPDSSQPVLKSLGHLLTFQPETGSVSLNMAVTKNLFQALGGKLIVRQRPQQGEVLTIFLPLEMGREIRTV